MFKKVSISILSIIALSSCSSPSTIQPGDGKSFIVTDRSYSEVWEASVLTIGSIGAIESYDRERGEIRGFSPIAGFSWGNSIGVFIYPPIENSRNFTVSVVGVRSNQVQITGTDYTRTMEVMLKSKLGVM